MIQPGSLELDGDAVLAIVVTGYLVFLPLQCWSRVLTHQRARNILFYLWNLLMLAGSICALVYAANKSKTPTQYMFCYPELSPYDTTKNDGWQSSWRTSTWNDSVWETFSNITRWNLIGDICYNPCFNSSQTLRQSTSLQSWVASKDSELSHPTRFWDKLIYSRRYIYSLIILCLVLNLVHLTFKFLPYRSRIPSAKIIVIWRERKNIWDGCKGELKTARSRAVEQVEHKDADLSNGEASRSNRIRPLFSMTFLKAFVRVLADFLILFGLVFSMIISPFTIIAFVAWAEWTLYNDGPAQESPRQVGQWSYLVSIGLLLISAAVLTLKYRLATISELDEEIEKLRDDLEKLEQRKEKRLRSGTAPLMATENTTEDG